ncbi:flagellar hook-associated protein FlgL [Lacisediminihabitans changchengi]|uniref:Flagellar hook-associated protein FlgL n=1 Tax=Lacisediminihabitans changchengi TaxID=2787634 RepID=A0A934SL39_9MICO|nr:flagellar hook-associated protein FlgL [Lacisediminihabitans changchengi]MBK4348697.1 flagellar hook-associated protein FlgL [Lacisediminihabitans changchengi]
MLTRVTSQTRMLNAQHNLQSSAAQLARLQDQSTTLKKIAVPSDDPSGTADSMRVRAAQSANAQYGRNIDDATGWLDTVDSTLSATTDILRRVRDLTVQGASDGSLSATAKEAIAKELEGLKSDLMAKANTSYLGRTVFAGNSDAGVAVNPNYTFTGTGSTVQRQMDGTSSVRVDSDGAAVFGSGATSVFALLDTIVSDLRTGVNVGPQLANIDSAMTAVSTEQSSVGARQLQVERAKGLNVAATGTLEAKRADVEDVDIAEMVLQLKQQEVTYQSALAVTSRTLQPTLMDFLR